MSMKKCDSGLRMDPMKETIKCKKADGLFLKLGFPLSQKKPSDFRRVKAPGLVRAESIDPDHFHFLSQDPKGGTNGGARAAAPHQWSKFHGSVCMPKEFRVAITDVVTYDFLPWNKIRLNAAQLSRLFLDTFEAMKESLLAGKLSFGKNFESFQKFWA